MKTLTILTSTILLSVSNLMAQDDFNQWFLDRTLRIDYNAICTRDSAEGMYTSLTTSEGWGGERHIVDHCPHYGTYYMELSDATSGKVLYTYSYNTLSYEWQSTITEKDETKTFTESAIMPMPRKAAVINIYRHDSCNIYSKFISKKINLSLETKNAPKKYSETILQATTDVDPINITILPEWYGDNQMDKFLNDAKKLAQWLTNSEPYNKYSNRFTINVVMPNKEAMMTRALNLKTSLGFNFNTFNIERYIASFNTKSIYDLAQSTAFRHIIILINTDQYGGSGFYNYYTCLCIDNEYSQELFLHEFGHAFAGLGDEYEKDVTYNVEPSQCELMAPNLTNLTDFKSKWANYIDKNAPIPTPKNRTDIEVGAFEGGGYCSKGVYRPSANCRMRYKDYNHYCKICTQIIEETIIAQTEWQK